MIKIDGIETSLLIGEHKIELEAYDEIIIINKQQTITILPHKVAKVTIEDNTLDLNGMCIP